MNRNGWIAIVAAALVIAALGGALIAGAVGDDDGDDEAVVTQASPTPDPEATATTATTTASQNGQQQTTTIDADDLPLTKGESKRVGDAALAIAGGGTVTDIGRSDDPGEAYEVEVLTDQGEIDIALDQDLKRVANSPYDD